MIPTNMLHSMFAIALVVATSQVGSAQLSEVSRGRENPEREERRIISPPSQPTATAHQLDEMGAIRRPAANSQPLAGLVRRLESLKSTDMKLPDPLEQARLRLETLRRRLRHVNVRLAQTHRSFQRQLADHAEQIRTKWTPVANAFQDGKERSRKEWVQLLQSAAERTLPGPDSFAVPRQSVIDVSDSMKVSTKTTPIQAPALTDLKRQVRKSERAAGVPPAVWTQIQDSFDADLRTLITRAAVARRHLQQLRHDQLIPVRQAVKTAEQVFSSLRHSKKQPAAETRRQAAWRLHLSRLARLRVALKNLRRLEDLDRKRKARPDIRIMPTAPGEAIGDLGRLIQVNGTPGAPRPGQFDTIRQQDLSVYYLGHKLDDPAIHYDRMVRANMARRQRSLRRLEQQVKRVNRLLSDEDRDTLRGERHQWYLDDLRAGHHDDPSHVKKRKERERSRRKELLGTRAARAKQRAAVLQKQIKQLQQQVAADQQRFKSISKSRHGTNTSK